MLPSTNTETHVLISICTPENAYPRFHDAILSTKYFDDESELAYFGYRYYSPELGRWFSRDPIGEQGGHNVYVFVANNSISRWDYLGRFNVGVGVGLGGTIVLPAVPPAALGLSGTFESAFHVFWDRTGGGLRRLIPSECGICSVLSVTVMGGVGGAVSAGGYAVVSLGPATDPSGLEAYSISVGLGGGLGGEIPGAPFEFVGAIEHDLMTAQTTLAADIPAVGVGLSAYAAIRITGNLTACSSKLWPPSNEAERRAKMLEYMINIREELEAAADVFSSRFTSRPESVSESADGEIIIDDVIIE